MAGLKATGRDETWKLYWSRAWREGSISTPNPFGDRIIGYTVVVEIINADGTSIGKETAWFPSVLSYSFDITVLSRAFLIFARISSSFLST